MSKNCRIFCVVFLICGLLLTGCDLTHNKPDQTIPTDTGNSVENPDNTETLATTEGTQTTESTQATESPQETDDSAAASLVSLRQALVGTPQQFAAAYFGNVVQNADPFAVMQESAPQLCEDLPFLLTIDQDHILGIEGQLFCIVPADENITVAVNRRPWNPENESYDEPEVLYRSENGSPILVMCPNEDWIPDTEVIITDANGVVTIWSPYLDPSYHLSALRNESGENLILDFTSYDELPNPDRDPGIDSSELVGAWELAWTEVEGDRNEAAPGACAIEITPDGSDYFRFTYTNKDFPGEDILDRELIVTPGELYPGCGNDQWVGEVTEESGDTVRYALTLLEDGTLLLQTSWEMDGIPMVSYGCYARID